MTARHHSFQWADSCMAKYMNASDPPRYCSGYRFDFAAKSSMKIMQSLMIGSLWSVADLHGYSTVAEQLRCQLDIKSRSLVIDADTQVGKDFAKLVMGNVERELDAQQFTFTVWGAWGLSRERWFHSCEAH